MERKSNRLLLLLVIAVVIAGKAFKFTKLLKLAKLVKLGKVFVTFFTMTLSVIVYSFALGVWFAIGFVVMLLIHELGHVAAMKKKGLPTSAPVFIPMLGAVIFAPKMRNRQEEAYVGYAGPLIGGLAALAVFIPALVLSKPPELLILIAYVATLINLFNLIPIRPLDGGRVTQIVGDWFKYVGVVGLLALTVYLQSPGMLLIWILVIGEFRLGKMRPVLGITCQTLMITMMVLGIGHPQPMWVNALDIGLATIMNTIYLFAAGRGGSKPLYDYVEKVSTRRRIAWLTLYLALAVALTALLVAQIPFIPEEAR